MRAPIKQRFSSILLVGFAMCLPSFAVGVLTTNGTGCPTISDHQRFMDEIEKENYTYRYPSHCVDLPSGTRVSNPIERKRDRFGKGTAEFILVEVAGKGRYWTLASWVNLKASSSPEPLGAHPATLKVSGVWFAKELRARFKDSIPIHGSDYGFERIACLSKDITAFDISAVKSGAALSVGGSLKLSDLPAPFKVMDGAQGAKYMLHLQAYLFSPEGRLVWEQQGFPQGNAWVRSAGDTVTFRLIDSFAGNPAGHELIVIAAGDPILSELSETRVILGIKKLKLS